MEIRMYLPWMCSFFITLQKMVATTCLFNYYFFFTGEKVVVHKHRGHTEAKIVYYLINIHISKRTIYFTRVITVYFTRVIMIIYEYNCNLINRNTWLIFKLFTPRGPDSSKLFSLAFYF